MQKEKQSPLYNKLARKLKRRLQNGPREYGELLGSLSYGECLLVFSVADLAMADLAYKDIKTRLRYDRACRRANAIISKLPVRTVIGDSTQTGYIAESHGGREVSRSWSSPTMCELYDAFYQCVKYSPDVASHMRDFSREERAIIRARIFNDIVDSIEQRGELTFPSQIHDLAMYYIVHYEEELYRE